jgi:dienelactone hydrolase
MAELLLFHHAQGLTAGCLAFAGELRAAGHVVHAPDLYEGRTFATLADGVGHAEEVGFDTIIERGRVAAGPLPDDLVYAGFSLGVLPAQMLAQTRPGASGAVLVHSCVPPSEFGGPWPAGVPLQIHMMEADEWALPRTRTSTRRAPSTGPSTPPSCSSTPAIATCSPTTACPATTKAPPRCSSDAC